MNNSRQNLTLRPWRQTPVIPASAPSFSRNPDNYRLTRALIACCGDYLSDPARLASRIRQHSSSAF